MSKCKCACDCGHEPELGQFLPGHDQKLRITLEGRVGGLLSLKQLVASVESYATGKTTEADLTKAIRQIFVNVSRNP
jgi:hypothetical protein